jgi:threonine dehydratase
MSDFDHNVIDEAYKRINEQVLKTPLVTNEYINNLLDAQVYFKLENLQWTGSFKLRGAMNKIMQLNLDQKKKGVVAYSSGNHAQAVAYASNLNEISSIVIMPINAPLIKINNTKKFGAEVILYNPLIQSREEMANQISEDQGRVLIKPYEDLDIIAGQGTSGKEIAEEMIKLNLSPDLYLCCCGGGGLIAGTSAYLKYKFPNIDCYAVEPEEFNDTQISLERKKITPVIKGSQSICDALLAPQPGDLTFSINKQILKGGLSVSDAEVKNTIIQLAENLKIVVEPGGAVAASALLHNKLEIRNKTVIVMISGGNIDNELFSQIVLSLR